MVLLFACLLERVETGENGSFSYMQISDCRGEIDITPVSMTSYSCKFEEMAFWLLALIECLDNVFESRHGYSKTILRGVSATVDWSR